MEKLEFKNIGELVEIVNGAWTLTGQPSGIYKRLYTENLKSGFYKELKNNYYPKYSFDELDIREKNAILQPGDIAIAQFIIDGQTHFYIHDPVNGKMIAESDMIILRGKNAQYVSTYLSTDSGKRQFDDQLKQHGTHVAGLQFIYVPDFKNIKIPIIPLIDLEVASSIKLSELARAELMELKQKYNQLKTELDESSSLNSHLPHTEQLNRLESTLIQVLIGQESISKNIEEIKTNLEALSLEFKEIKKLPRNIDDKLHRLHNSIDLKLTNLLNDQDTLESYVIEIKRWFEHFDHLEEKSQKYLPQAEYIFDKISQLDNPDYSPFILQYCRALENELLQKIFRSYVQSLIDRDINIEVAFAWDIHIKDSGKPNNHNTYKICKHLIKCLSKESEKWFFELGAMEVNLRYLTGKTLQKSPLLQDLKIFVLGKFENEILSLEYLDKLKRIIQDYRNQSAHPNLIGTESAQEFHKVIKQFLNKLMENYKKSTVHNM